MQKKSLAMLSILLTAIVGAAAVGYVLTVNPLSQEIPVMITKDYTVNFTTNGACSGTVATPCGTLTWDTSDPLLFASIDGAAAGQTGHIDIVSWSAGTQSHTLYATPQSGIVLGDRDITVAFSLTNAPAHVKASVTAGAGITPEVPTGILATVGLVGLVGLVRYRKKNN